MISFLARYLGKLSGPILVYVLLGLIAANATTGYLLKHAWQQNARAVLQCENQALRDANEANEATTAKLLSTRAKFEAYRKQVREQTAGIEKENADIFRALEIEHGEELANLEVAINEISNDDYYCATEPVSSPVIARMRDAATTYNENKGGDSRRGTDP